MPKSSRPWYRKSRGQWYSTVQGTQFPLGVFDPENREAAVAALQTLLAGLSPPPTKPSGEGVVGPDLTICAAVDAFTATDRFGRLAEATRRGYRYYLGVFVRAFGTRQVRTLTAAELETDAARPTWGDDTRRNYLCAAELALKAAGWAGKVEKPARGSAGSGVVIPEAVYHMAVGAATGDLRPLLILLWNTGCRPSEATGLTAEVVDWDGWTARLTKHKTRRKTGKIRLIVFNATAMAVLREQREKYGGTGLLFRSKTGTRFGCKALTKRVWAIGKKIGKPITAYGCRHTYATDALAGGCPDTHVAALLGHAGTAMLHKHYSHVGENARVLKDAAARVRG